MEYRNCFQTEDERSSGIQIGKGQGGHFQCKNQGNIRYDPFRVNRGREGGQHFRHQSDSRGGRRKGNISFQVRNKDQNQKRGGNERRGIGGGRGRAGERERGTQGIRGTGEGRGIGVERGAGGGRRTVGERGGGRDRGSRAGRRGHMNRRGNYMSRQPAGGSSSEEDDSAYCEYCDLEFKTTQAYHVHTRGMLHTQRVLEGKKSVREKSKPDPESNEKSGSAERSKPTEQSSLITEQSSPIVKFEPTEKSGPILEPIIIEESDSDEDTSTTYCLYCNMDLKTAQAYYIHTRGMLHTQKVIDDKKMAEPQAKQESTGNK
ncbi:hypothetical protein ACJMK2_023496 [Sinanodonta woodiana]|uniref:C2H2-type domain-containing protein n=1 Tax=Sinanodonta woodiana TaxID=1069815 RepID=A0ABD3T4M1_SINWO